VDIAREAGVSIKTVSRVLNEEPHVKAAVRTRVKEVAKELNYHPNINAQGLIARRNYLIGLTYERPSPSYVVELQRGALERLAGERYRLMVLPFGNATDNPDGLVALLRTAALDGVVFAPPSCDLIPVLDALDSAGIAYGRIAPTLATDRGACAAMDDIGAAREIAEHVIGLGHRRFAVILGDPTHSASKARLEGYRQAFAEAGLDFSGVRLERGDFTFESGYAAAGRILRGGKRPTAILAQNDDMAVGTLMAARDLGLAVPDDLSITGFDDSEVSRLSWPRITTIRQPVFEMAVDATDGLLNLLAGNEIAPMRVHPHQLLVRQSTAPPPKR
jgi:LacI family transcriptional regulator